MEKIQIRAVSSSDADCLATIYNHYITHTIVTFETSEIDGPEMQSRIDKVITDHPWLVAELDGKVIGYAYSSWWNTRAAYNKTLEVSVYLHHEALGKGIGKLLYGQLIDDARNRKFHTVIGGISLPNAASIALHESFGFEKAAHYKEVGFKFGKWIDVGYWQLILD